MKTAILGAGLTGLELGRRLHLMGKDFTIFEKESQLGGLARTFRTGIYSWDLGVHAMYSKDKIITGYYDSLPIHIQRHTRNVKIRHGDSLISYPFENAISELPLRDRWECVRGYLTSHRKEKYSSLEDWIVNRLGYGISKHFMTPYNKKIWDCPLYLISAGLVSGKIDPMSVHLFILSALGYRTIGRAYQSKFVYPLNGIQEFIEHTAADIRDRIQINKEVTEMKYKNGRWLVHEEEFDRVVSTIPLPELLKILGINEALNLKWNNTRFIMIGLKPGCTFGKYHDCHWAFFKGAEIFYRLTFMHNFSNKFPAAVVAEVTDKYNVELRKYVVSDLLRAGIILGRDCIAEIAEKRVEYTYPIPTIGTSSLVEVIENELRELNLHLLGRNGRWRYINMDGVIKEVDEYVTTVISNNRGDPSRKMGELLGVN